MFEGFTGYLHADRDSCRRSTTNAAATTRGGAGGEAGVEAPRSATGGGPQRRPQPARLIDAGEHLALMQIVADGLALGAADLVGAAAAGAAAVEPEHQARLLLGAAVVS